MMRRGFTVVELVITITIMGILLTLGIVALNATQVNARDTERKGDIEALGLHLENFYNSTYDEAQNIGGQYLATTRITEAQLEQLLPDLDIKSVRAPGVGTSQAQSLVAATNTITTVTGITPLPSITNDVYVYQPLTATGALCTSATTQECRRFNLYYYEESSDTVKIVSSKHQS